MPLNRAARTLNQKCSVESYNGYHVSGFKQLIQEAGPFLGYLIMNLDHWTFAADRTPFDANGYDTWIKFNVPGGDRKNTLPRTLDPEAHKIYTIDSDLQRDMPVFEVHYGRLLRMNMRSKTPKRMDWLEIFTYLTPFQNLSDTEKLAYLQEQQDWQAKLQETEDAEFERHLQDLVQTRIISTLNNIEQRIQQHRSEIRSLHRERILCQHQTQQVDQIKLDLQAIRRLHGVDYIEFRNGKAYVRTTQLPVRYMDPAIYDRYRSNYYTGWQLELMDLVIEGYIEICTSPIVLSLRFDRPEHLSWDFDHLNYRKPDDTEVLAKHPHRTCQGNFDIPIQQACENYDTYGLVSNVLQWFQSLAFDDSHVCRVWLFETGGFRLTGQPETLVNAQQVRACKELIKEANKLKEQNVAVAEPAELTLDLDLELELPDCEEGDDYWNELNDFTSLNFIRYLQTLQATRAYADERLRRYSDTRA